MSEPHEHIEHIEQAEHSQHHATDPFNQRVAVSMAIVAACLACISMIGHRTHNEVLQLQGDANRLRTQAATAEVEMSNLFAWYQSKKLRQSQYEISANIVDLVFAEDKDARAKLSKDWKEKAAAYDRGNDDKDNLPDLKERGAEAKKRAKEFKDEAREYSEKSERVHHQADRIDIGNLLAEVALVLCSITLLTKKKVYWYAGLVSAAIAVGLTLSAYTIPNDTPHETKHENKNSKFETRTD